MVTGPEVHVDGRPVEQLDRRAIRLFIEFDRIGAAAGGLMVLLANAVVLRKNSIWFILAAIVVLVGALTVADRLIGRGHLLAPLALIAAGNWLAAIVVATVLPFLWPVMTITVLMPLVVATPYLDRSLLRPAILSCAVAAGVIAALGLWNDDGGALPDMEDEFEFLVVVSALVAHIAPIGLIVWQNNRLQHENLHRATELNEGLRRSEEALAESRRRVVQAADTERRRIERDLHDGAQQRLVAMGVRLRLLESQSGDDPQLLEAIRTVVSELDQAVEEVRELAHGIYPPLLQTGGLVAALTAVARRSPLPVEADLAEIGRLEESTETALYFTALEALTNAAKHAPDATVILSLVDDSDGLVLTVADDGPGFVVDPAVRSNGTHNMGDRLAAVGGNLLVDSTPGNGTRVVARIAPSSTR